MNTLIPAAFASSTGAGSGFDPMQFVPLLLIFAAVYFLVLRPQQKKSQQIRTMLASLDRGDRVVTAGGIVGDVARILNEQEILLDIADGVQVRVIRQMIVDKINGNATAASASASSSSASTAKPAPVKKAPIAPARKMTSKKTSTRKK